MMSPGASSDWDLVSTFAHRYVGAVVAVSECDGVVVRPPIFNEHRGIRCLDPLGLQHTVG